METTKLRIGIIGGGPAGLLAALALKRKGFEHVSVFEGDKDAEEGEKDYSISLLNPNGGLSLIEDLGLLPELEENGLISNGFRILDGGSGKILFDFTKSLDERGWKEILRNRLRAFIASACAKEGVKIHWNANFLRYEEKGDSVGVEFAGGEQIVVDLLIGADGVNSPIRKQLVGDPLKYTGFSCITGSTHRNNVPELFEHMYFKYYGLLTSLPACTLFNYHHPPDIQYWGLTLPVAEDHFEGGLRQDKEALKRELLLRTAKFHPLVKTLLERGEVLNVLPFYDRDPLKPNKSTCRVFNSLTGRITLIGDAAHPMVPFEAAAGNTAAIDAKALANDLCTLLAKSLATAEDIAKVLSKFEAEMMARTTPEVLGSRSAMHLMHSTSSFTIFTRNVGLRIGNWVVNTYSKSKTWQYITTSGLFAAGAVLSYGAYRLVSRWKNK